MEGLEQANTVLTSSKSAVMAELAQITATMNVMQAQLKTLSASATTRPKMKYYCWICGSNFLRGSKACTTNKVVHKDEANYKKILGGRDKGCE